MLSVPVDVLVERLQERLLVDRLGEVVVEVHLEDVEFRIDRSNHDHGDVVAFGPDRFENLVAVLGALGLALGFALKDYVSSLIAGIVVIYEGAYRPGDWVEVEGAYGEVRSVGMRAMEMVTPDDTVVVVPHQTLWTKLIHNANDGTQHLQCVADFYLDPEHEGRQVRSLLRDVALTSPYLRIERSIDVIAAEQPWGTHYRLKAYPVDPRDQFRFTTDLTVRGKAALRKADVPPARVRGLAE